MPADLITQLELAGELLDQLAPPLTIDEIVPASDRPSLGPTHDAQPVTPVEADGNASTRRSASSLTWLRVAAATLLVAGGAVALLLREPDDSDEAGTTATTAVTNSTPATSDELPLDPRSTEDWPPDAFPAGAVLRVSEPLGPYGHVWVYDIPSDGSVCVVRKTIDGYAGCSVTDAETYRTGQAWALEGDPQSSSAVLWGLAPVDMPITVTAGDATASSGPSGIWYLAFPAGTRSFTIVTPTATYPLSVTSQPLPTTTSPSDTSTPSPQNSSLPDPRIETGLAIGDTADPSATPPAPQVRADGTIDLEGMPVWITVSGIDGRVVGYAKTADLYGPASPPAEGVIIYDENLTPIGRITGNGVVLD